MSIERKNKRVRICVMVGTICIVVAGLWAGLVIPETALAKGKPGGDGGDSGNAPVCIGFLGGGIESDGGGEYCDDKQLKVEAIMTPDGHVNLQPNTGRGDRFLNVYTNLIESNPLEGWRFLVGGWNENFDMRTMALGEIRTDVNLIINTTPPDAPDGTHWRLIFDPHYTRWNINYNESTYVTVERLTETTWKVHNTSGEDVDGNVVDQCLAVRVIQTKAGKNKSDFNYGGVVTVPLFSATVTLVP